MIKTEYQLKNAQKRLEEISGLIEKYQAENSGIVKDLYIIPLLEEQEHLEKEITEFNELVNFPSDEVISNRLSEPELIDNIGELLAKIRIASKITQGELAARLGWEQSNISRFESENYNSQTIHKIVEYASALGVWLYVTPSLTEIPERVRLTGEI